VKRRYIGTRKHGVMSQKTLTFTLTAVELENLSDCLFLFPVFFSLFPTFLYFISHVFSLLLRILLCFLYCLFISFFPCILVSSFHFPLFPPPLLFIFLLRLLFTYTYFPVCWFPISNCQQTIDTVFVCVMTFCVFCQALVSLLLRAWKGVGLETYIVTCTATRNSTSDAWELLACRYVSLNAS
jgi:hypothetical protein